MALAEVRAAWQRTANRCLVQEDAKRAPRLACCSSLPPSAKEANTEPSAAAAGGQDIPTTCPEPFNQPSSCSNLSPNSRWWLHLQPSYGYHKCLTDNELNSAEVTGSCERHGVEDCDPTGQTKLFSKSPDGTIYNVNGYAGYDVKRNVNELYVHPEASLISSERNIPWWRTADTEELASLVAERSDGLIENCDLPRPWNAHVKKNLNANNICRFGTDNFVSPSVKHNLDTGMPENVNAHVHPQQCTNFRDFCPKLGLEDRGQVMLAEQLCLLPKSERIPMYHIFDNVQSKAELLEALRHSQTRAREAEKVAEQVCAQKEHVVKLIFKQASLIFAYKQWLQLLQLENMYFQIKDNVNRSASTIVPIVLPWTPLKTKKMRKSWQKPMAKKRAKKARSRYDVSKYAVVFALGLGLVGAGLLLGWTVAWMLW